MINKNLIAFVDLLGTSELSRVDPDAFYTSLTTFQEAICNFASYLETEGEVYFFSDCAYIQSPNIDSLVLYLRAVRQTLSEQGLYMKGAISGGSLNAQEPPLSQPPKKGNRLVTGCWFGPDVVTVYGLQDGLRGIGIRIDKSISENFRKKGYGVASCHLPQTNSRHAEYFSDLKFSPEELNENILKIFVRNFFKTNTRSRRFGRYYISFLVSWINSADLSGVGRGRTGDRLEEMPLICQILMNGMIEKHFTDLSGLEFIYFALLEKAYNECNSQKAIRMFETYIAKRKKLISRLETMPRDIFGERNRRKFLDFLSGRATGTL
jgi:hypothetical protein